MYVFSLSTSNSLYRVNILFYSTRFALPLNVITFSMNVALVTRQQPHSPYYFSCTHPLLPSTWLGVPLEMNKFKLFLV